MLRKLTSSAVALALLPAMAWAAPALHSLLGRHVPAPELTRQLLGPVEDGRILHISMGLAGQRTSGVDCDNNAQNDAHCQHPTATKGNTFGQRKTRGNTAEKH